MLKIFFSLISSGGNLSFLRLTQGVLNLSQYGNTFMQLICKEICEEKALPKWRANPAGGLKGYVLPYGSDCNVHVLFQGQSYLTY